MRTTSGFSRSVTSRALRPSPTAATTERSGTTPRRSSSDSRKISLSSTITTVMGSPATSEENIGLLRRKQKRVVGLAAVVHLDLELGMLLAQERDEVVHAFGGLAREDGEHVGAGLEEALEHLARHGLEHGARERLDGRDDLRRGRVHGLPALNTGGAEALEEPPVAGAGADRHDAALGRLRRRRQPFLPLGGLDVHVLDVDLLDDADGGAERERGARLVRVEVHLHRAARADDHERVAEAPQLLLEPLGLGVVTLDEEGRAVAEARELLVDRLVRDRLEERRRLGERLAADVGEDAAQDLEQARRTRVHHA